ncbi:MAG: NapC/NirT family cytochrome c, partial [Wenzhouxiangella sp.]
SGVSAECRDCHVPKPFFPKMGAKIKATLVEVPGHLTGKISTEEKFLEHKLELAEKVWARMKANDSRECRNCHSYEVMSAELQNRTAQRRHSEEYREATGSTCIDCHKGIVHSLPADM